MAKDSNGMMLVLILSQVSTVVQESPSPEMGNYGDFIARLYKIELIYLIKESSKADFS
jgi:hypothetical protein